MSADQTLDESSKSALSAQSAQLFLRFCRCAAAVFNKVSRLQLRTPQSRQRKQSATISIAIAEGIAIIHCLHQLLHHFVPFVQTQWLWRIAFGQKSIVAHVRALALIAGFKNSIQARQRLIEISGMQLLITSRQRSNPIQPAPIHTHRRLLHKGCICRGKLRAKRGNSKSRD
jgi:hypothetical protein